MQPTSDFEIENFSVLAYANGFSHWHYEIPVTEVEEDEDGDEVDAATCFEAVEVEGYFNPASARLKYKDLITVTADEHPHVKQYAVASNEGGVVEIVPLIPPIETEE